MNISRYSCLLFFALLIPVFVISCGSSDGGDSATGGSPSTTRDTVTIEGSISDAVADSGSAQNVFLAEIKELFTAVQPAFAQQQQVLEGILVEAFEGEIKLGEDITDETGSFTITDVPCDTPLTLIFTYEGSSVTLEGISAPCPGTEDQGVIAMVVSINFEQDEAEAEEIEDEDDIADSVVSCSTDEQEIDMNGEEFSIDGGGNPCLVTTGNCKLDIKASNVVLTNCSTCIDTRGGSSVEIKTTQFDCVANSDGIRSVGGSSVDITVISSEMMDDTVMPSDAEAMQHMGDDTVIGSGNGEILIIAGEDGIDSRGNSKVELETEDHESGDDEISKFMGRHDGNHIIIEGVENGIIAVGNSEVEIESTGCEITPEIVEKGNAEVELECNSKTSQDDDSDDEDEFDEDE